MTRTHFLCQADSRESGIFLVRSRMAFCKFLGPLIAGELWINWPRTQDMITTSFTGQVALLI
jgi:hypothetical protein